MLYVPPLLLHVIMPEELEKGVLMIGNRGITLQSKLPPNEQDVSSDEEIKKWKKQVELLTGSDDKSLFKDVEGGKKVI